MRYEGTIAIPPCRRERSCALSHRCLAQSRASDVSYVGCRIQLVQCRKTFLPERRSGSAGPRKRPSFSTTTIAANRNSDCNYCTKAKRQIKLDVRNLMSKNWRSPTRTRYDLQFSGFRRRPSGMESGQQQHRDKSEYTRHYGKIEDFAGQTWKSMN